MTTDTHQGVIGLGPHRYFVFAACATGAGPPSPVTRRKPATADPATADKATQIRPF
ncbi:hypothetical protein [Sodalis sp.]|uniref:hypothetical protein n=1 Tax=Sodalis sp. (in: enterobacteria) TaxID=1898979 RepID=UPI003872B4EC